ncbi:MAG TPA: Fe-S cluster assembly protein SufD [Acetobacteraceae bacterium]|jgi:Fe-S cluster assembly protein SufD|nr:Fe-S cluster assembly protein SufD [Acetobacteraceae bacterium]
MNAPIATGVPAFLARFEGLRTRLPGDPAPRLAAAEVLRTLGLPGRRNEAWHYTNLRPIEDAAFSEPLTALRDSGMLLARVPHIGTRLVFVDGRFRVDLSDTPPAIFRPFAMHARFGDLAQPAREPLVALNTMLAEDGAIITLPNDADGGTITLVSLATEAPGRTTAFHPRHQIRVAAGARLTLVEVALGTGTYLHNPVTEIAVEDGATLTHVRLQDESPSAYHLATLYSSVAASGTYDSFTLTLGGRLSRTEIHATLTGAGAIAHLNAAQILTGIQHADFTSVVRHAAPNGTSRQTVKNVLAGSSRGVFQGRIEVARDAQKTDGYQMNQALLLSPDAEVNSKPELEIFADDVKCSHGATVGELDAEQLFYLRSRGVPASEARAILVRAFLSEAIEAVAHDDARAMLERAVSDWWEQHPA